MKKAVVAVLIVLGLALAALGYRAYLISQVKKPLLAMLSDPAAAQFDSERYFGNWTVSGGLLCGRVNAKNKMGGYSGFQWFTGDVVGGFFIESDEDKKTFDAAGVKRCDFEGGNTDHPWWWLRY